jgi:predicted MFS family arabinose efflux permease
MVHPFYSLSIPFLSFIKKTDLYVGIYEDNWDEKLSAMKYGVLLTKRGLILILIFFFIFYTSYFVFFLYVPRYVILSTGNRLIIQASFNFIISITLLVTSFFIHRINKLRVIYACSIVTLTLAILLFFASSNIFRLTFIFAIVPFFSIGQLAFFMYFWNLTVPEERGRVAGLSGFVSLVFYLIMYSAVAGTLDFHRTVVLGIILSLGALVAISLMPRKAVLTAKKDERGNYPEKRAVLLYSIPWVLFSLINATFAKSISFHISQQVPSFSYLILIILQTTAAILGTFCGGVAADFFGRRVPLAFSLTLYGISSALVGIANNYTLLYFVYVANGLSWGILLAIYGLVIWGDLANKENCAKMYAIGYITFYVSQGIGLFPLEIISQIPLVVSSLVGCLLIFLSNIPIFLAPELLPLDFREKIKMKLHMEAVKKIKQS